MDKAILIEGFVGAFGYRPHSARFFFAPGRVNIIGEHIDYNGGLVMPTAINLGTYAVVCGRAGNEARFASANFPENVVRVDLGRIAYDAAHSWANYPKGIIYHMQADGHAIGGFDIYFSGNIPHGAGLSSSASIEMAMAMAANGLFGLGYDMIDLALLAQRAENAFCGVNCGIMDQFAVGMGKAGHALLLNCNTLEHEHLPLDLGEYGIVVMDTKKSRALADSAYNQRNAECQQALELLKVVYDIEELADLSTDDLVGAAKILKDDVLFMRTRHVVSENDRVKEAARELRAGNTAALGALLAASHSSLARDYEVSCTELDTIVDAANSHPACIGARMTGAGFGGCAIALVQTDALEDFAMVAGLKYLAEIGHKPEIYPVGSGEAGEIQ